MTKAEKAYMKKINELIAKVGRLEDVEVARVAGLLNNSRKEIASRIIATEWDAYHIPQMTDAVNDAMLTFSNRYKSFQTDALANMFQAGVDAVDWPLNIVGFKFATPELSATALEILQGFSIDLISGLTQDAVKKINAELTLGVLGNKTHFQVMQGIGGNLTDKGVFKTIASRAETITRTEMARVHSTAREARNQATIKASPGEKWLKKWLSSHKANSRDEHAELDGETVPVDENFPGNIPYPHAPGLPAADSINCG